MITFLKVTEFVCPISELKLNSVLRLFLHVVLPYYRLKLTFCISVSIYFTVRRWIKLSRLSTLAIFYQSNSEIKVVPCLLGGPASELYNLRVFRWWQDRELLWTELSVLPPLFLASTQRLQYSSARSQFTLMSFPLFVVRYATDT